MPFMADVEVTTHIDAAPGQVWDLIGDPTRMGDWSPECQRVTWKGGEQEPKVGARFTGHNRIGWRRWNTTGTLVEYAPGQRIAWDVTSLFVPVARWGYEITADAGGSGCTVTETFDDHRHMWMRGASRPVRGVADTNGHNRKGMEETLARIKARAEAT